MKRFFKRLFGQENHDPKPNVDAATVPLSEDAGRNVFTPVKANIAPPQFLVGTGQSVGMQRDHNEDAIFSLSAVIAEGVTQMPFGVFIIADGMGGHMHGEKASGSAARAMGEALVQKLYSAVLGETNEQPSESLQEIVEAAVVQAQNAVLKKAPGGGTTLTVALVVGDRITFAHVGDSRAYIFQPPAGVQLITQDHSLVNRLLQLGQLTEEEAAHHPQKNVLYRALGQSEPFKPDIHSMPFPKGAYLLLCSDGLWGLVSDDEMMEIIQNNPVPTQACAELVETANLNGGPDNISVILVQYLA